MQVVEIGRKRKYEISPRQRIFRITPIYRIAGEHGRIAKVLHATAAIPARSVNAANPRNSDPSTDGNVLRGAFHHVADNLMSGNQTLSPRRKFSFDNMQVGTADPACPHFQQHMTRFQRRTRNFLYAQRTLRNILGCIEDRGYHRIVLMWRLVLIGWKLASRALRALVSRSIRLSTATRLLTERTLLLPIHLPGWSSNLRAANSRRLVWAA